ncbi:hypothetical protein [uncultured Roseivirga sp.]|uniref:hypothetical protein n=1 Tax=uncultured Roseivirga sp. TaxID=543088 RepID=UPI0030D90A7C
MKNFKLKLSRHLFCAPYAKLILLLSFSMLSACSSDDLKTIEEVQIEGGHQVQRTDGDFEFKYGLFNDQGQPTTEFKQGDIIIFSFWIKNDTEQYWDLLQSEYKDFFRVYKLEGIAHQVDMGQPHDGMFFTKQLGVEPSSDKVLKFELPWIVPESAKLDKTLWKQGRNAPPLEKGVYKTTFDQSFDFRIGGQTYETALLSFIIDFTVN